MLALGAWASTAAVAEASTVTIGSVLPAGSTSTPFGQTEALFNTALPEKGANLTSPVNGAIVRWRVLGAKGGPFYLRVLHPNGSGAYQAVGTSGPATPTDSGLQTFPANIPVHAGDLIGVDPTSASDEIGVATAPGSSYAYIFPPPFDGATVAPSGSVSGSEIELSAEVQPAPAITSVAPDFGSVAGGTKVTIEGTNLAGASGVKFGSLPAASFVAESETQVSAVAPAATAIGRVDVTLTTLAGTSATSSRDSFVYDGCLVPSLKGKTLKVARKALKRAHCKLGKVTGPHASAAKVTHQSPKPGKALATGTKVKVKTKS